MPNWCYNNLTVDGTREGVNNFITAITTEVEGEAKIDLTAPYPCPEELQIASRFLSADDGTDDDEETKMLRQQYAANKEKYGSANWYDWQIDNWGTKWQPDVEEYYLSNDGKNLHMNFDSAWAPPTNLIKKLSEKFPTLQFVLSYDEGGMCFAGAEGFYAGEMVYNGYFEYDSVPEWNELSEADFDDDDSWEQASGIIRDAVDKEWDKAESAVAEASRS
jgi:hypothetical protein